MSTETQKKLEKVKEKLAGTKAGQAAAKKLAILKEGKTVWK